MVVAALSKLSTNVRSVVSIIRIGARPIRVAYGRNYKAHKSRPASCG